MRDIPSIEYAGGRCGNYGFCRPQIYGVTSNLVSNESIRGLNSPLLTNVSPTEQGQSLKREAIILVTTRKPVETSDQQATQTSCLYDSDLQETFAFAGAR